MRHAVKGVRTLPRSGPVPAANRPNPALTEKVFAALGRAPQDIVGSGLAIKPKQAEDRTGAAAHNIQPFVRRDEIVGDELSRDMCVREQAIVTKTFRYHGQRIDD